MQERSDSMMSANGAAAQEDMMAAAGTPMDQDGANGMAMPPDPTRGRPPRATIGMAVMFAAGVAIVFVLSTGSGPEQASASDEAVEQQVESFLSHTRSRGQDPAGAEGMALVKRLSNYASRRQVPLEDLQNNPFSRSDGTVHSRRASNANTTSTAVVRVANSKRRTELLRTFSRLKLQGVMVTSRGATAIINSSFVTVGAKVEDFTVTAITPDAVELTCDEMRFMLHLQR